MAKLSITIRDSLPSETPRGSFEGNATIHDFKGLSGYLRGETIHSDMA